MTGDVDGGDTLTNSEGIIARQNNTKAPLFLEGERDNGEKGHSLPLQEHTSCAEIASERERETARDAVRENPPPPPPPNGTPKEKTPRDSEHGGRKPGEQAEQRQQIPVQAQPVRQQKKGQPRPLSPRAPAPIPASNIAAFIVPSYNSHPPQAGEKARGKAACSSRDLHGKQKDALIGRAMVDQRR